MRHKVTIYSSDNKNTRNLKKSWKRKLKSKNKQKGIWFKPKKIRDRKIKNSKKRQYVFSSIIYNTEIQHFCDSNNIHKWKSHDETFVLDSDFSLYNNPSKVMRSLLSMLFLAKTKQQFATLNYKGNVSFGALYFIDTICWQISKSKKWYLKHNLPSRESNILGNLKSIETNSSKTEIAEIINSKIRINREDDDLARQQHKIKSKEIRDLIIRAIKENYNENYELSHIEHTAIDSAISEHFDNILLHVPQAECGYLCGFFDKERKEVIILIYNFGHTIADSLDRKNLPYHVQEVVNEVVMNFTKKSKIWGSSFTKENALTLLAIQEGISSKLDADITRGHGIIDFIEHCMELNDNSRIVIISGKTAIKIDSKYKIQNGKLLNRSDRRIIAFNDNNDIFEKPDSHNVRNLSVFFPGVIIETTIPLKIN